MRTKSYGKRKIWLSGHSKVISLPAWFIGDSKEVNISSDGQKLIIEVA